MLKFDFCAFSWVCRDVNHAVRELAKWVSIGRVVGWIPSAHLPPHVVKELQLDLSSVSSGA